jgi:hypothetical protein
MRLVQPVPVSLFGAAVDHAVSDVLQSLEYLQLFASSLLLQGDVVNILSVPGVSTFVVGIPAMAGVTVVFSIQFCVAFCCC